MNELSLHILDIVQNSMKANATLVEIVIEENDKTNEFNITIKDNGFGMDNKTLSEVADPFFTTRTTRKVGLGVSLFKMACELTEGTFTITSKVNIGTTLVAKFKKNHIDRAPLGDIEDTLCVLLLNEREIDIYYEHLFNDISYVFDSREIKKVLDGISFTNYEVITWIKNNIKDGLKAIKEEEQR